MGRFFKKDKETIMNRTNREPWDVNNYQYARRDPHPHVPFDNELDVRKVAHAIYKCIVYFIYIVAIMFLILVLTAGVR